MGTRRKSTQTEKSTDTNNREEEEIHAAEEEGIRQSSDKKNTVHMQT